MNRNKFLLGALTIALCATVASAQFTLDGTQARVGDTFTVSVNNAFPNSVWALGIDVDPGPTSIPSAGLTVDLGFTSSLIMINDQIADGSGVGHIDFAVVNDNAFAGGRFYLQAFNVDPTNVFNIALSNARKATIHPSNPGVGVVTPLTITDDGSVLVPIGFSFPFYSTSYTEVYVNANGNLSFGQANGSYLANEALFVGGPPSIAPAFYDFNPDLGGTIETNDTGTPGSAFSVHWVSVEENMGSGPSSFTVTLYGGGHIAFDFDNISPAFDIITGITPGSQATYNNLDLSTPGFEGYGAPLSIYESFTSSSHFDLADTYLLFGRVGSAGYMLYF